jgi:hypothetical protein
MLVSGCAVNYDVKPGQIKSDNVAQYQIVGPIYVQGEQQSRFKELQSSQLRVDYREVAEAAADMLNSELEGRIGTIDQSSPKTIHIHISDMSMIKIWECHINFMVETGEGYSRGYQASGKSWDFTQACNKAMPDIAARILADEGIRVYLQK